MEAINSLTDRLGRLPRRSKRLVMILTDALLVPLALWSSVLLHDFGLHHALAQVVWIYAVIAAVAVLVFMKLGLYRAIVRFMGSKAIVAISAGVFLSGLLLGLLSYVALPAMLPVNVLIMFVVLSFLYVTGSRFTVRLFLNRKERRGDRVAIYGAGEAGAYLASSLTTNQRYTPVFFIDDNLSLRGSMINGLEVFSADEAPELIRGMGIDRVLLAVPAASRRRRGVILSRLERLPVHVQTMPNLSDLISGATHVDEIREVDVDDLLGRDAVPPVESLLDSCIEGKCIMVTGAGGSIGSELCRQIVRQRPKKLLMVESSELALYNIDKELSAKLTDESKCELFPLLGNAQNESRMREIMTTFGVQTVYHAAAYKHVPLVEQNVVNGIRNNVFGTLSCAQSAIECGVETFVLVSTDKAVCPTNVMGATKRMAEMVLQGLDEAGSSTRFCMVRFGNVLASSGSVVPLFREQIQRGGPVTVTHPDIIRYFMTIPEAAQLVIQAGSLGTGGDVFLLDMGKPVRIADLARRMIHLMGMTVMDEENPEGDVEIRFTGLRPAEKLYEELLIGNNVMGTEHPMIMRAEEKLMPWNDMRQVLNRLADATERCAGVESLDILRSVVEEYVPSKNVSDLILQAQAQAQDQVQAQARVTEDTAKVTSIVRR